MNTEKRESRSAAQAGYEPSHSGSVQPVIESSTRITAQAKLQAKLFGQPLQNITPEEEDLIQDAFPVQKKPVNNTGLPDDVKTRMESGFGTDFSNVRVHANSSKATGIGALAYTRGHDIHVAPGQFSPATPQGQQLLGHELAHVVQQREGRVQPTTEVAGIPVNDSPNLEKEADSMGNAFSR
ncbi:MAG: DUF4157 domain-containing protein [Dehalococcoidales bacterium]|nr:DUF4157 domain-containing protein [Dehalococcoidales bacterium]